VKDHGTWKSWGVMQILDKQDGLRQYAGPGRWNDPDMLEVGNGMVANQDRAHFAMWAMIAAPLIAGNDLRSMSKQTIDILTNKEVIAVNQDELGIQGFRHSKKDSVETWFKPLKNGDWAVCFLNRSTKPQKIDFEWTDETINDTVFKKVLNANSSTYQLKNLWTNKIVGTTKKDFEATVPAQDVIMMRLINKP
jgi:alpha-galactosidase